jgi:hypothetical protein
MSADADPNYKLVDFNRSLTGWWRFEGNDNDESGFETDMLPMNGAPKAAGRFGQAYSFDGVNDYAYNSSMTAMPFNSRGLTFSLWVYHKASKSASVSFAHAISLFGENTATLYINFASGTGYGAIRFRDISGANYDRGFSVALNDSTWHHVAATFDGSNLVGYLDGTARFNLPAPGQINRYSGGTDMSIFIGTRGTTAGGATTNYWNGSVDDVIVLNRSLSAGEVLALYNAQANQYNNNFGVLSSGRQTINGYAVDSSGTVSTTGERVFYYCGNGGCGSSCVVCLQEQMCQSGSCVDRPTPSAAPGFEPSLLFMIFASLLVPVLVIRNKQ